MARTFSANLLVSAGCQYAGFVVSLLVALGSVLLVLASGFMLGSSHRRRVITDPDRFERLANRWAISIALAMAILVGWSMYRDIAYVEPAEFALGPHREPFSGMLGALFVFIGVIYVVYVFLVSWWIGGMVDTGPRVSHEQARDVRQQAVIATSHAVVGSMQRGNAFKLPVFGLLLVLPALAMHVLAADSSIRSTPEGLEFDGFFQLTAELHPWASIRQVQVHWDRGNSSVTWELTDGRRLSIDVDDFWGLSKESIEELAEDHKRHGIETRLIQAR